jgi:hypothetical protein
MISISGIRLNDAYNETSLHCTDELVFENSTMRLRLTERRKNVE